jgi:hypothetical protein
MRITESVELSGGASVTVKELTVAEVRGWLLEGEREKKHKEKSIVESMGVLCIEGTTLQDLALMTDLKLADMDDWTNSDIQKVLEVCKRMNAPFFLIQQRFLEARTSAQIAEVSLPKS